MSSNQAKHVSESSGRVGGEAGQAGGEVGGPTRINPPFALNSTGSRKMYKMHLAYTKEYRKKQISNSALEPLPKSDGSSFLNAGFEGKYLCPGDNWLVPVSYTHLTLPTNREV